MMNIGMNVKNQMIRVLVKSVICGILACKLGEYLDTKKCFCEKNIYYGDQYQNVRMKY